MARDPDLNQAYAGRMFATWYTLLAICVIFAGQIAATLLFTEPSSVRLAVLGWSAFATAASLTALYVRYTLRLARQRADSIIPEIQAAAEAAAAKPEDPGPKDRLVHASETFINSPFLVRVVELPQNELSVIERVAASRPSEVFLTGMDVTAFEHLALQLVRNTPRARQIPRIIFGMHL